MGWSRDGIYGRGFISSAIDDGEVLLEIIKNLAIVSRTRALNTKIVSIGTETDRATIQDINQLDFDLKNRREDEHIIINKPVSQVDLSHAGKYEKMETEMDYLRKDIASGLVPNFLTPWNESVNKATASEMKIPFQLELDGLMEDILLFLKEIIIDDLRQEYTWLSHDAVFEFGHVDLTSREERMTYAQAMFQDNVLTMNEYREAAGYEEVDNGDVWAYQMPTLPVSQMSVTEQTEEPMDTGATDVHGSGDDVEGGEPKEEEPDDEDPQADELAPPMEKFKVPSPPSKKSHKISYQRTLKSSVNSSNYKERLQEVALSLKDDIPLEEVFLELFDDTKDVEALLKKFNIGSMIKPVTKRGLKLDRLQKGDTAEVQKNNKGYAW